MKKLLILTTCALALTACSPKAEVSETAKTEHVQTQTQNEKIDIWFEEIFTEGVKNYPQFLTRLGDKTDNDKWNNPSKSFYLDRLDVDRKNLEYIKANFDLADLDESHALSYRLFVNGIEDDLARSKYWDYDYIFNQMFGLQSGIPAFLINNHRVDNIDDARAYIARLNGVKEYLGTNVAISKSRAEKGIAPPLYVYDHVIRDAQNIITGAPFDEGKLSTLLADFQKKVKKLELTKPQEEELFEGAITALLTSVKPAFEGLVSEMKTQQAHASTDDGAWKLPNGGAYYKSRLKQMTTTDMTASEIHDLGLSEVARIHTEMREIMTSVGFKGDLQAFFTHLKTDPKFVYEDSDAGREAYLAKAEGIIDVMKTRLDDVFMVKPKADLVVKQVESYRNKSAGKAFYNRPAPDGSRPGVYYANLYKITDMPKYQMEALAYHEGIPGHHMQIAIQQELEGIPKFRKFSGVTAYSEGWGLYSEFLPKEMGFYQDPYSDFGRLAMEIWRAARLVVDTGIHDKKWTREQAIQYLIDNTPNPENDCVKAIERYIVMPGQATAYKIGMLKILELRENAKSTLGDKFDIREYHNVIISSGPVPLNIMQERVEAWVKSKS
ncbi:MAG: DUF885 domain-containing protein [Robiginitomaculum sp.]|nr:MAG: DUF885 domain-containing protein [Robiginitomaculum sp.]